MKPGDQERVAGIFQVLKDGACVLAHQDRVRWVVVNPELVADAVPLADAVQRDPCAGRVGDVVVKVVGRRPAWHRALLDTVGQPPRFCLFQQRHELILEVGKVLIHAVALVAADKAADRAHAQQDRRIEHAQEKLVLLSTDGHVVMEQVVEVADVRQADTGRPQCGLHATRPLLVERAPQIERVRHRVEHRFRRDVGFARVQRGRQLDDVGAKLAGEACPVFDRAIRVGISNRARRQLLQRRRQDADRHELRLERMDRHAPHTAVQAPPAAALARIDSTTQLAR